MKVKAVLWTYSPQKDGACDVKIYASTKGAKKYYSTGISILPEQWDNAKALVKRSCPGWQSMNAAIQRKMLEVTESLLNNGALPGIEKKTGTEGSLLRFAETYIDEVRKGLHNIKESTCRNYTYTLRRLEQYCERQGKKDLSFADVTVDFYFSFSRFLADEHACGKPGISKHVKQIKKWMGEAVNRKLHQNMDFKEKSFRVYKHTTSNKIYLNAEEIAAIERLELSTMPALERERDRFLVSYYFLIRYSDSVRIKKDFFFQNDEQWYYRNIAQKTGKDTILPVKPAVLKLMEKYNYDLSGDTNQEANRKLKMIASMAGIVAITQEGERKGPKCNFVCTHTARRSAATNLALQNVSLKLIADLGGWERVETLRLYLRASGIEAAKAAKDLDFFQ